MDVLLLEILKNIPILSDIDKDELKTVVKKVELKKFPKGTYIFHEGDKGDVFYIIKSGKIEILRKNKENKEERVATLYPDNFFGEMALLDEKPRNASAKSLEDTELIIYNKKDFFDFLYL
jgi:CRP-like cAMP-binding protein